MIDFFVIDNFYDNPIDVRNFALQQNYNVKGNFPGQRTESFISESTKNYLGNYLEFFSGEIKNWNDDSYTGAFQICIANDRTWIHSDKFNGWAGVCYLNPGAPLSAGTAFYKHKESGKDRQIDIDENYPDGNDYTRWERTDYIANKFNRLVMYKANLFHASLDYFGYDLHTGRLIQTFFINTEK